MTASKKQKDPYFDPRNCTYRLSRKIRDHVEKLIKNENVSSETKTVLVDLMNKDESNKNTLNYESLVKLHKYISRADTDYIDPFYIFSEDCKCIQPKPRENKELEKRLNQLRHKISQEMYDKMTSSVDRICETKVDERADRSNNDVSTTSNSISEFKNLYGSLVAVFNSFLVFICTFIFFYKAIEYALPQSNIIAQVACGLGASTIVAIAELYFIVRVI